MSKKEHKEKHKEKHKENAFASGKYPEVKVEGPNLYYASLLMDDYASSVGEFGAINQYLYHHFITEPRNKHVAETLRDIAIVEMKHMELLADAIIKLGGNPVFKGYLQPSWNPRSIFIGRNLRERIIANINAEQEAINNYQKHIHVIHDGYIRELLARIIDDEQVHIKILSRTLEKLSSKK